KYREGRPSGKRTSKLPLSGTAGAAVCLSRRTFIAMLLEVDVLHPKFSTERNKSLFRVRVFKINARPFGCASNPPTDFFLWQRVKPRSVTRPTAGRRLVVRIRISEATPAFIDYAIAKGTSQEAIVAVLHRPEIELNDKVTSISELTDFEIRSYRLRPDEVR